MVRVSASSVQAKEAIMGEAEARPPFGSSSEVASSVKDQAANKARELASQARSAADSGKDRVASQVDGVAQAFHRTGDQLREENQVAAQFTDAIGTQIERIAGYLQGRDVRGMVDEVQTFARRQPALFLGGAFTAGLLLARFLKSSANHAVELGDEDLQEIGGSDYLGRSYPVTGATGSDYTGGGSYGGAGGSYGGSSYGQGSGTGYGSSTGYEGQGSAGYQSPTSPDTGTGSGLGGGLGTGTGLGGGLGTGTGTGTGTPGGEGRS
jgi:hypothetical protein